MLAKRLTLLLGGLLITSSSLAGEIKFKFQKASNGVIQFRMLGEDLCDSSGRPGTFTMTKGHVGSSRQFVTDERYVSKSDKSEWNITKSCTVNQQLTNELLTPGKALKVQTYDSYGYELERFYIQIPCDREFGMIEEEYLFHTDITTVSAVVCDSQDSDVAVVKDQKTTTITVPNAPVIIVPKEEPKLIQACSVDMKVDQSDMTRINVYMGCAYKDSIELLIHSEDQILFNQTVAIKNPRSNKQLVASLKNRNPFRTVRIDIDMDSRGFDYGDKGSVLIKKEQTYVHKSKLQMITPLKVQPKAEAKALGRGSYFQSTIEVFVQDKDIETSHPDKQIRVQLINTTNGQFEVLNEKHVSTDEKVSFSVDGQYVEPNLFGSNYWDEDYVLQKGKNTFKIRVYDAYKGSAFVDSEEIQVILPNL